MATSQEAMFEEILKRLDSIDKRLPVSCTEARLTEREKDILEAVADQKMTMEELASKAGYPVNSHFKSTLSSLVKRGRLVNDRPGYRKPKSGLGQD